MKYRKIKNIVSLSNWHATLPLSQKSVKLAMTPLVY